MTGTFRTGWDRNDADEWATPPTWWQRIREAWTIRQMEKEMRGW